MLIGKCFGGYDHPKVMIMDLNMQIWLYYKLAIPIRMLLNKTIYANKIVGQLVEI